jgi:hypothetical protein
MMLSNFYTRPGLLVSAGSPKALLRKRKQRYFNFLNLANIGQTFDEDSDEYNDYSDSYTGSYTDEYTDGSYSDGSDAESDNTSDYSVTVQTDSETQIVGEDEASDDETFESAEDDEEENHGGGQNLDGHSNGEPGRGRSKDRHGDVALSVNGSSTEDNYPEGEDARSRGTSVSKS